jgi:DNA-directed RNA polymerase subunit omega
MARITSQEAAKKAGGLFDLVLIASQRTRELKRGAQPLIKTDNGHLVTAIKEIEQGLYNRKDYLKNTTRKRG